MKNVSRALIIARGCAVIAGCTGTDMRYGKGDDHEVAYRAGDRRDTQVVYVDRQPRYVYQQPRYVYVQPVQPAYVYYPTTPQYQVVPVIRTVPTTRYVYVDD